MAATLRTTDADRAMPPVGGGAARGLRVECRSSHGSRRLLVDAHVHLYPCFDVAEALDAACANAQRLGGRGAIGWLLLTETARDAAFDRLRDAPRVGRWRVQGTLEPYTLELSDDAGERLRVSAGRQLQTAEGLEIQALGCDASFPDGLELASALERIEAAGALPVVPWGFGKWWGGRGRVLDRFLRDPARAQVALGDSGQRLAWSPRPAPLARAGREGRLVLAGSDPLPFADEVGRICAFGMAVDAEIDPNAPLASLFRHLRARAVAPLVGSLQNPAAFARNQVRMQLRKRSRSSS